MKLNEASANALLRQAEGKPALVRQPDGSFKEGRKPTASEQRRAQFVFAESLASGEVLAQILPTIRRRLSVRFETVPLAHPAFTRRMTTLALNVNEEVNVFSFDDQANIPALNAGDGFVAGGLPTILPRGTYPQIGMTASGKTISTRKIGEALAIDWETIVRSRGAQVRLIDEGVSAFARHARNQEDIDVAKLLVKSTGFQTGTNEPIDDAVTLTANPDLRDPVKLAAAIAQLAALPVQGVIPGYSKYVVLTSVANAPAIKQGIGNRNIIRNPGATSGYSWTEDVDFGAEVEVIGWKWLSTIWSSIGAGAIIVPVPSDDELPVLTSNYLEGYEEPSYWLKDSNARQVGGGEVNPAVDGDFDSDSVTSKVRHAHGADALWVNAVGVTTGANS